MILKKYFILQRLAEIAHSLLKVSPYDPESMGCRGLQRYMTQVLPAADWADDALRPALIMILRRLDKVFLKIAKKPSIRVRFSTCFYHRQIYQFITLLKNLSGFARVPLRLSTASTILHLFK